MTEPAATFTLEAVRIQLQTIENLREAPRLAPVPVVVGTRNVFALLAFAGQTLAAAAMPFGMAGSAPGEKAAMSAHGIHHGHSMHSMNSASDSSVTDEECCQHDSACPISSCMSAGIVPTSSMASPPRFSSEKIPFPGYSFASAAITSLYRPPISR